MGRHSNLDGRSRLYVDEDVESMKLMPHTMDRDSKNKTDYRSRKPQPDTNELAEELARTLDED